MSVAMRLSNDNTRNPWKSVGRDGGEGGTSACGVTTASGCSEGAGLSGSPQIDRSATMSEASSSSAWIGWS